jgi:endonuclease-3
MAKLATQHPNADTELQYSNAYELLVATILSAQCTDERVNQVTPALFMRYPNASALAEATTAELEPQIQSTGFFRAKSRSLLGMANACVEQHGGNVPATMDELVQLPGVGRKTANVVLGHALGVPGLPVDRHVLRVSNRIGIARSDDPEAVEQQLCSAMPRHEWTKTSDTLILHGRRICKPRPLCDQCAVRENCDYYMTVMGVPLTRHRSESLTDAPGAARRRGTGRKGAASAKGMASLAEAKRTRRAPRPSKKR